VPQQPAGRFFVERSQAIKLKHAFVVGEVFSMLRGDFGEGVELEVARVAAKVGSRRGRHERCGVELQASSVVAERPSKLAADGFDAVEPQGSPVSAELFGRRQGDDRHMIKINMVESGQRLGMSPGEHVASRVGAEFEALRVAEFTEIHPIACRCRLADQSLPHETASVQQHRLKRDQLQQRGPAHKNHGYGQSDAGDGEQPKSDRRPGNPQHHA